MPLNSVITGTGSYIPTVVKTNADFINERFYCEKNEPFDATNEVIIEKFKAITGIEERRYASDNLNSSDIAAIAAQRAIADANIDPETLDYIIFAQNFGDIKKNTIQTDIIPSLAARVKQILKIENPHCVAYDIIFGCPGWIQGMIQAHLFIKAGEAKRCLVIGSETLSRVLDMHDRDSMIYSDGAGAAIVEAQEGDVKTGILGFSAMSHTLEEAGYLFLGKTNYPDGDPNVRYLKMFGRKIYEYALNHVPDAMKAALDKNGIDIHQVKKVFMHQANEKMDEAIIKRFFRLYKTPTPKNIMPMSIHKLGNSSVATVPTLLNMVLKNKLENHQINKGDVVVLASVGAGMNINAIVYKF
ncbi:MAG: ketoacyl-ACP synthase III [Flavobacteriales bacterium]|jgi:3-oxoacyl-[acyl-carrier-protein] synthase III|nr:ketoacyl-ACP synthase III [Flavobacteriales bacterium]